MLQNHHLAITIFLNCLNKQKKTNVINNQIIRCFLKQKKFRKKVIKK